MVTRVERLETKVEEITEKLDALIAEQNSKRLLALCTMIDKLAIAVLQDRVDNPDRKQLTHDYWATFSVPTRTAVGYFLDPSNAPSCWQRELASSSSSSSHQNK